MFQKKQIIYSETLGVCVVDNIVSLAASKREKAVPYYVLKPVFEDKVSITGWYCVICSPEKKL